MRNRMTYLQMTSVVALCAFINAGCGNRAAAPNVDMSPSAEQQAQETAMETTYALVDHNFDLTTLDPAQAAMANHALAAFATLSEADRAYLIGFVPNKLAPRGITFEEFLKSPDAVAASFAGDPELARISQAMRAELGLTATTTPSSTTADGVGVQNQGLTAVIDCLTVVIIALIVGLVIVGVAALPGLSAIDFCKNCQTSAVQSCAPLNKESKVYCSAGATVQGNGNFDSKKDVYEAKGSENASYVCQYQCI